jgi:hypothetical protein
MHIHDETDFQTINFATNRSARAIESKDEGGRMKDERQTIHLE